jgi:hypothetical protein
MRTEEVSKRNLEGDIASLERVSHYKNNIQNSQRRFGYGKEEVSKWNLGDTSIRRFFTGLSLRLRAEIFKVTAQERRISH